MSIIQEKTSKPLPGRGLITAEKIKRHFLYPEEISNYDDQAELCRLIKEKTGEELQVGDMCLFIVRGGYVIKLLYKDSNGFAMFTYRDIGRNWI